MEEPEKPFACTTPECGMTFTNEDHLNVHTRKHDMILQLGFDQKATFVADQTPTPTRFIRNCEEVGLFQDLQNVNPFEEGFKRAMETCKHGLLSLENASESSGTDDLHTPQMVFPLDTPDPTIYTTNNHKNITISRSSSDESGKIKEYETTTISKLTNKVTKISRLLNKPDFDKSISTEDLASRDGPAKHKDMNETSVSYTNNVLKIHNNIKIIKDNVTNVETAKNVPDNVKSYADSIIKDCTIVTKDVLLTNTTNKMLINDKLPTMMSQKSLDFVVDTLTSEVTQDLNVNKELKMKTQSNKSKNNAELNSDINKEDSNEIRFNNITNNADVDNFEVIIKLPTGKTMRMKADDTENKAKIDINTKEKLKTAINNKVLQKNVLLPCIPSVATVQNILPMQAGTLIPITILNPTQIIPKIPIRPLDPLPKYRCRKAVKRKNISKTISNTPAAQSDSNDDKIGDKQKIDDDCVIVEDNVPPKMSKKKTEDDLNSGVAASRRYRIRLKEKMKKQVLDIKQLKEANQKLLEENARLKRLLIEHSRTCSTAVDLKMV